MTVPTAAIQRGAPGATPGGAMGTYVYLVNANNTVSVRQITVGPTYIAPHGNVSMTTVETGLSAGDRVVTDGADRLRDGLHVNVSTIDGKQVAPAADVPPERGGQKRQRRRPFAPSGRRLGRPVAGSGRLPNVRIQAQP